MIKDPEFGLNLADPDSWTEEEQAAFTASYMAVKERTMPGHDLWIDLRPDVLKRYRHYAVVMNDGADLEFSKIGVLCFLHHYAIVGFEEGILYQIINARNRGGANKATIVSTLAVAFLQSGPLGTSHVAAAAGDLLRTFVEPEQPSGWPKGWDIDPGYFRSGLDFTKGELEPGERELLEDWYIRAVGEIPPHVQFLATCRPRALKAQRHRYEFAIGDGMPKQMMPLLQLQYDVSISRSQGIRSSINMAKRMGIEREYVVGAISRGALYGGTESIDLVQQVAGDLFEEWD